MRQTYARLLALALILLALLLALGFAVYVNGAAVPVDLPRASFSGTWAGPWC